MDKRGIGVTSVVIIAAVVAVVASVLTATIIESAALSPTKAKFSEVNAHRCNADDTCETNSIKVGEVLGVENSSGKLFVQHDAFINNRAFIDRVLANQLNGESLNINEEENLEGVFMDHDTIIIDHLSGFGSGFVCVNSQGKLHRSEFPCSFSGLSQLDGCFQLTADVKNMIKILQNELDPDDPVVLKEMEHVYTHQHLVLPGDNNGSIVKVRTISNSSSTTPQDDNVEFENDITGDVYQATITEEGVGMVFIEGVTYHFTYHGSQNVPGDQRYVVFDFPHTESGALMTFYCDDL